MQATRLFTVLMVSFFFSAATDSTTAQTITHVPLYNFRGDSAFDGLGGSVSDAGDVNGDGFADLIVGATGDSNNGSSSGSARVLSGSDGSVLYLFNGDSAHDGFGGSVSGAGDVDGDGTPDLIVGASGDDNNGDFSGSARVFSGRNGSILYTFNGAEGDRLGRSVSGAGDVNGDGTPDLIVGAQNENLETGGSAISSARVLSGSDGSVLHNFEGGFSDYFGRSVSGAGDVNGDGFADLIVGARYDSTNGFSSGRAYVLSGIDGAVLYTFDGDSGDRLGWSVSEAGDVNRDGFDDFFVGAPGDGSARVLSGSDGSLIYNFEGNGSFGSSVDVAGDVNGDGIDDFIVGASGGIFQAAYARVFSGSDGSVLYTFNEDDQDDAFGRVSGAGDVNGDGIDDFIVGAPGGAFIRSGYARVFVSQILGDCNQDGDVNFLDIAPFIAILTAGDFLGQADTNQDGVVNFLDIGPFIALLSL